MEGDGSTRTAAKTARLEQDIAEVCGLLNAATGRLVALIAEVLAAGAWEGWRIRSPEHWVAWKCGVSPARARSLVAMARRLPELPETKQAFDAGELAEDQVAVVCRHAPASVDGEVAELARSATVTQLRRVLGSYSFDHPPRPEAEERRQVSFGYVDEGWWRCSALLPADEGALWERALTEAREALVKAGENDATWADALISVAEGSLVGRVGRARATVLLHVDRDGSHLHLGPAVGEGMRDFLTCDSRVRLAYEEGGRLVSVGRAFRTVPDRTRIAVDERDRGCRVPGCPHARWLHVHHIQHWRHGGTTDTANLLALCSRHHRLLHLGRLRITGNADEPDGLVFTDDRARAVAPCGRPGLPRLSLQETATQLGIPDGGWSHPSGDFLDPSSIYFNE